MPKKSVAKSESCWRCKTKSSSSERSKLLELGCCHRRFCFSCLSKTCMKALQKATIATCCACHQELSLKHVQLVLSRTEFAMYFTQRGKAAVSTPCASCSCKEPKDQLRVAPCGHQYCQPCVRRMCRLALGDRSLVPLRCCKKELPHEYVREALVQPPDYEKYQSLLREKDWTTSDLASDTEYATIVQAMGAKQCPGCGVGVQRDFGCVHMTCPLGHQFCFTCLQTWGICNCPLIPEAELAQILHD